jgi:hypothetical protein
MMMIICNEVKNSESNFKDANEVGSTDREEMPERKDTTDTKRTRRKRVTFYVRVPGSRKRKKVTFLARR